MTNIKVEKFSAPPMGENSYILYSDKSKNGYIIDPGSKPDEILDFINQKKLKIKAILNTHGHFDHMIFNQYLVNILHIPVLLFDEKNIYQDDFYKYQHFYGEKAYLLEDFTPYNDDLILDDSPIDIIKTPGHTPGGVCYYLPKEKIIFAGDTLFKGAFGRYDFPYANFYSLKKSLKTLFNLPDDVLVYSGHGSETEIATEKLYNPILFYF